MREENRGIKYSVFAVMAAFVFVACFGFFAGTPTSAHAQAFGVTLPSVPTGVSATVVPPSQISISWAASTESSGTIADYYVYRNGSQVATTGGTLFVDSGLSAGLYQYTVAAIDANGNVSAQSSPGSITFTVDTTPPSVPTNIVITGVTSTNSAYTQIPVTVSWGAATDNVGVTGYRLYRSGTLLTTSTAPYTSTSYADTIIPGTYFYTVVAYDAAGNVSNASAQASFTVNVDLAAPSVPKNISVQQTSATGANVSWSASTDSVGIAGYQVYRNNVQIASAAGSPYADTGLTTYTPYTYTVAAYDTPGNVSAQSVPATITLEAVTGPSMPDILSASSGTSTVKISWASVADNLALTGYQLYRNGTQIASVTSTNYLDQGLASGTYAYTLTATDITGAVSTSSLPVSATVPAIGYVTPVINPVVAPSSVVNANPNAGVGVNNISGGSTAFTQSLYFGLRNAQVSSLQSVLVANGYLASVNATGFFGNLTLHALERFQCDQNIVCTGGAGWGLVGPKTRTVLNNLNANGSATVSGSSDTSAATELQVLEAELASLEKQLP